MARRAVSGAAPVVWGCRPFRTSIEPTATMPASTATDRPNSSRRRAGTPGARRPGGAESATAVAGGAAGCIGRLAVGLAVGAPAGSGVCGQSPRLTVGKRFGADHPAIASPGRVSMKRGFSAVSCERLAQIVHALFRPVIEVHEGVGGHRVGAELVAADQPPDARAAHRGISIGRPASLTLRPFRLRSPSGRPARGTESIAARIRHMDGLDAPGVRGAPGDAWSVP